MSRERLPFFKRVWAWITFIVFYLIDVIRSNLFIAWDVLTVDDKSNPSIIKIGIPEEMTNNQVLLVSNLMTMTPGTLTLELTEDRKFLLVHVLYSKDVEETRQYLIKNYVERVIHLF